MVVVKINGYKFRALLDSEASHSYASATAIDLIDASLKSTGLRQIGMLTGVTTRAMQVFGVVISSVAGYFELEVDVTKVKERVDDFRKPSLQPADRRELSPQGSTHG